ncbi:MAG TPA: chromate transporter, partial [Gammaproteobacteria bacterium]|nr:chromate transporter [Gammaproteobacteria bacterium]
IVVFAAYRIGSRALRNGVLWIVAAAAFIAITALDTPFPAIVLVAAGIGYLGGRLAPEKFRIGSHAAQGNHPGGPAFIDDHVSVPPHARFSRRGAIFYSLAGVVLWGAVEGVLYAQFGWQGPLTQMGWFFTKAAFVTFGGAYAVLPYVYQGAIEAHGWLTPEQMIDGLALGETTPGPLIMVVAFVGFVGAWTKELFGPDSLVAAGIAGAAVATFFTFLPSFLFILIGGPAVEASRGEIKLTAPLTGITAAVVGVILSLAVFFAWHVLWPEASAADPFSGKFEWFSLLLTGAALLALWRFKVGVTAVIGACGVAGLLFSFTA